MPSKWKDKEKFWESMFFCSYEGHPHKFNKNLSKLFAVSVNLGFFSNESFLAFPEKYLFFCKYAHFS